jgi:hypothetical protein
MLEEDYCARLLRRQFDSSVAMMEVCVPVTLLKTRCYVGALSVFDRELLTVSAINLRYGGPSPDGRDGR